MSRRDLRALAVLLTVIAAVCGLAAFLARRDNDTMHTLYTLHALVWSVVAGVYWRRTARTRTAERWKGRQL